MNSDNEENMARCYKITRFNRGDLPGRGADPGNSGRAIA
jgi:hypothetical protein